MPTPKPLLISQHTRATATTWDEAPPGRGQPSCVKLFAGIHAFHSIGSDGSATRTLARVYSAGNATGYGAAVVARLLLQFASRRIEQRADVAVAAQTQTSFATFQVQSSTMWPAG